MGSLPREISSARLSVFGFAIRHLGGLRRFPILVHSFDVFLRLVTAVTAPTVLGEIRDLTREVSSWPDVTRSRHRFGGREFEYRGIELGHVHGNGVVDVLLTRAEHDEVLARGMAHSHHIAPNSGWVTFFITGSGEARAAAQLLAIPFHRLKSAAISEEANRLKLLGLRQSE